MRCRRIPNTQTPTTRLRATGVLHAGNVGLGPYPNSTLHATQSAAAVLTIAAPTNGYTPQQFYSPCW